jgi:peptide deformylase
MNAAHEIAQLGADILRQIAEPLTDIRSTQTRDIITAMQDTLAGTQGVGLAAPQISISKRVIIVASRPTLRYPYAPVLPATVMLNPSFYPVTEEKEQGWEGCLSIPSIRALVPRYSKIMITFTDTEGEHVQMALEGFVARVFQHEYDHLDGKVYLDRVEDMRDIVAESEYFKRLSSLQ